MVKESLKHAVCATLDVTPFSNSFIIQMVGAIAKEVVENFFLSNRM